jgi:glycolate oxidase iron-sulfur subunit
VNLEATGADLVAAGNVGCLTQIGHHGRLPAVHTVELLDWATGGPRPKAL